MDIEVETDDKTIINVGLRSSLKLQCLETGDLFERSVVYASKLISEHSKKGKSYKEPKVISIWIIRDPVKHGIIANRISPIEEIVNCVIPTKWQEGYEVFTNKSRIIWVQLSNCKGELLEKINEGLKEWIQFFRNPNEVESKDKGIKEAQYKWTKISSDEQMKAQMRAQEKYEMDRDSELCCAREEGKEEGIKEGEQMKMKELAINMKKQGLEDNFIAKCLNTDLNTLKDLLNN